MSQQITFDARIEPALFMLKYSTGSLRNVGWSLRAWSFITVMRVVFGLGGATRDGS